LEVETQAAAPPQKVPWFPWIGRRRPFYGWVIVGVGSVGQFLLGIVSQGFTTYLSPLQQEFGWSRAALAGPRSVTQIEGAIMGPLEGYLVDRFGPRLVMAVGTFIMGLGLILFGMVETLWQYYAANLIIAVGFGLGGLLVISVAVNHWFRRRRTVAQSFLLIGYAVAGIIGVPALVLLQDGFGWRAAAIVSGLLVWGLGLPAAMFLRRSPEPFGLEPDGGAPEGADSSGRREREGPAFSFALPQAMRTRTFWFLSVANGLSGLAQSAMMVHLFLHLEQGVGLSRGAAALIWTLTSASNIPSRIVIGVLGDRLPKHLVWAGCVAMMGTGILVLGLASSLPMAVAFAVLYGIGWGGRTPVQHALHAQYWGLTSLGKIVGTLQSLAVPFSIAGPIVAGLLADLQGDYRLVLVCISFGSFTAATLILLSPPPKPPESRPLEARND
jgi:MFS family permease